MSEPIPHQQWMYAKEDPANKGSFLAGTVKIAGNMQHVVEGYLSRGYAVVKREGGALKKCEVELGDWGYQIVPAKKAGASTGGGNA